MYLNYGSGLFFILLVINHAYCADQSKEAQNVGTFLTQLLRDYVPKNARPYTIINGVPPNLGPIGRIGGATPARQQFPGFPYGQLIVAPAPQKPQMPLHPSQDRWSPVFPIMQTGPRGRSEFQFVPTGQFGSDSQPHVQQIEDSQDIITADHNQWKMDGRSGLVQQEPETAEFQIQSQMAF